MWDSKTGTELREFTTVDGRGVFTDEIVLAISPDSKLLAAARNNIIWVWDVSSGNILSTWDQFSPSADPKLDKMEQFIISKGQLGLLSLNIKALAFSMDGNLLVGGGQRKKICIWDWRAGKELRTLKRQNVPVEQSSEILAITPDGKNIISVDSKTIVIWDFATGESKTVNLPPDKGYGSNRKDAISISPDSKRLAFIEELRGVTIFDIESGQTVKSLAGHSDFAFFSPDSRQLTILRLCSEVVQSVWDLATFKIVNQSQCQPSQKFVLKYTAVPAALDVNHIALVDVTTKPWNGLLMFDGGCKEVLKSSSGIAMQIDRFSIDVSRRRLLTRTTLAGWLPDFRKDFGRVWDESTGGVTRIVDNPNPEKMRGVISPDGRLIAFASPSGEIMVLDYDAQETLCRYKANRPDEKDVPIWDMAFDPKGHLLASIGTERILKIYDIPNRRLLVSEKLEYSFDIFGNAIRFSPDGLTLAVFQGALQGKSNAVILYSATSGKKITSFPVSEHRAGRADFSPNGTLLAVSENRWPLASNIKVWRIADGKLMHKWELIPNISFGGVCFSSDGKLLAFANRDNSIRIMDLAMGKEVMTLKGHGGKVNDIKFHMNDRMLISVSDDTSMRLWDTNTGDLMASLYSMKDSLDWLVVTPDGLFDGSPDAWQKLLWRFEGNTFNTALVELFFNEFYYPGLLTDILQGKKPKALRNIAALDRRQPRVLLSVAKPLQGKEIVEREVTITLDVQGSPPDSSRRSTGGVKDLRLFRNGILVKRWQGTVIPKGQDKAVMLNTRVTLVSGENRLVAYAFNDDNIKSSDATLAIKGAQSLSKRGTLYLLAVGLNEYANSRYNLAFAVPDAGVFTEELKRTQTALGKYEKVEVISLYNRDATKANILAALYGFAGQTANPAAEAPAALSRIKPAQPEDALIIYYAGHGTANKDRFYLLPHDLGYAGDPANLTEKSLEQILAHGISDREIEEAVVKIDAGRMVMVIDACNSGQALDAEEKRRGPMNSKGLAQLAYEKGMYVLTAAQSYQVAMESAHLGHGFLTFALAEEALKSDVADTSPRDGQVFLKEWLDYAVARVPEIHQEMIGTRKSAGRAVSVVAKPQALEVVKQWDVQRPRVFYRREPETNPMVIVAPKNQ